MLVKPCMPYHGKVNQRAVLRMPDGVSVFKTYFISITGREDPSRYEWDAGRISITEAESLLLDSGIAGVGFITAFPHITKFFRFAPSVETVMHVKAFQTPGLQPMPLDRDNGFTEFACLGEALIAADEYQSWAQTPDVATYLSQWSQWERGAIVNHAKLAEYAAAAPSR